MIKVIKWLLIIVKWPELIKTSHKVIICFKLSICSLILWNEKHALNRISIVRLQCVAWGCYLGIVKLGKVKLRVMLDSLHRQIFKAIGKPRIENCNIAFLISLLYIYISYGEMTELVECAWLEITCGSDLTQGSNPCLSAKQRNLPLMGAFFCFVKKIVLRSLQKSQ